MTDELELGRVRRRLDVLAEGVEPPGDDELCRLARAAASVPRRRARRRPLPAAALALAAGASATALAVANLESDPDDRAGPAGTTALVGFPEGSALRLLTSNPQGEPR